MGRSHRILCLAVSIGLCAAGSTAADVVTDWNNVTLDTIRATGTNPPRATRTLAMVHVAMFEAVNGFKRAYEPYLDPTTGIGFQSRFRFRAFAGGSPDAAAVWAAHTVLVGLYPARQQQLEDALEASLAALSARTVRGNRGRAFGTLVGREVLALRAHDGADAFVHYVPSGQFGNWQPTPPAFAPALLPNWPYVTPFAMTHGAQFRVPPPPPWTSDEYAEAFEEVRLLGDADSADRTADQTQIAYFWEDGAGTATPPGHWQVIAQQLAERFGNDLLENARLFALLSIVQADAAISCWDNKYTHDHARPYTAITSEADADGNPDTVADPGWSSLIPTPPFPSYTSGHSTFSAGSARLLARFFGSDAVSFCAPSPDPQRWPAQLTGVERCWSSLSQAAEEAGQSRIYGGIHWQYDNQYALSSGRALADHVFSHFLTPRGGGHGTGSHDGRRSDRWRWR